MTIEKIAYFVFLPEETVTFPDRLICGGAWYRKLVKNVPSALAFHIALFLHLYLSLFRPQLNVSGWHMSCGDI